MAPGALPLDRLSAAGIAQRPTDPLPGLARFARAAGAHLAALLALAVGASLHALDWAALGWVTLVSVSGHLLLFRWLWGRRGHQTDAGTAGDPIVFVHTLFGFAALTVACTLLAPVRGVTLQLVLVIVAFDIHRLSSRQVPFVAAAGVVTAALPLIAGWVPFTLTGIVTVGGCLATLGFVGRQMREIQVRQTEQRRALATALSNWQTLAHEDALTGALSRRHGIELLQLEAARQRRDAQPFSIGMLDVDHFKRINDVHGHGIGDEVLVALVRLATASLGAPNKVVRWGGEEFLLLLPDTPRAEAVRRVHAVHDRVRAHDWARIAPGLAVDVSIGVAEHAPDATIETSVAGADAALYAAKSAGRGRVR